MCEGTWVFGGVHQDGQLQFCTASCPFWSVYFFMVFYVLVFMIIVSSWIDGVIGNCYPDTFYLFLIPHLLKQPFIYNILAFMLNVTTSNKYKQFIDFSKMILFDIIYTLIVFGWLVLELWNIDQNKANCIIKNKSYPDDPYYYDPISIEFVLYSLIIIHGVFLLLSLLRLIEGIVYFDRKRR